MTPPETVLRELQKQGLYRSLKDSRVCGKTVEVGGVPYKNFAANDYLGISADTGLQREFLEMALNENSFILSAVSSRLLGGNNPAFSDLENYFAGLFGKSALLLNSGYHANTGAIPAICAAAEKTLVLCDKLAHASMIDGMLLCGAKWMRFKHNDLEHLESLLEKNRKDFDNILIVTESVFSMDGDRADIKSLIALKKAHDALLYVDEAHSFGVFGETGLGICSELGAINGVDFIMCTLGKAAASEGAIIMCSREWRELLVNKCRSLIFSTAIAPVNAMWTKFVFEKIMGMGGRRRRLAEMSAALRGMLENTLGDTQIVPVVLGENERALRVSEYLWQNGIWAPAVRHPSVPRGQARLRLSLTSDMDDFDIAECAEKIRKAVASL